MKAYFTKLLTGLGIGGIEMHTDLGREGGSRTTEKEWFSPLLGELGVSLAVNYKQGHPVTPDQLRAGRQRLVEMFTDALQQINKQADQPALEKGDEIPSTSVIEAPKPSGVRVGAFVHAVNTTDRSRQHFGSIIALTDTLQTIREYTAAPDMTEYDDVVLPRAAYEVKTRKLKLEGTDGIILYYLENQFEQPRLKERLPRGWNKDVMSGMSQELLIQIALGDTINDGSSELAATLVNDQAILVKHLIGRVKPEEWDNPRTKPLLDRVTDQDQVCLLLRQFSGENIPDQTLYDLQALLLNRLGVSHLVKIVIDAIAADAPVAHYIDESLAILKANENHGALKDIVRMSPADRSKTSYLLESAIRGLTQIGDLHDLLQSDIHALVRESVLEQLFYGYTEGDRELYQRIVQQDPNERVRKAAQKLLDRKSPNAATA